MKLGSFLAVLAAVALFAFAAPANAATLSCGATITENTTLDSDVVCTDPAATGVHIAADNITLQLNGHTIRGAEDLAVDSSIGIDSTRPVQGVQIRNGTIEGFDTGVEMTATNTQLLKLNINAPYHGVKLHGSGATTAGPTFCEARYPANDCVYRSVITIAGGYDAVLLEGDNNHLWGNTIRGQISSGDPVVETVGDKPRIVLNRIEACGVVEIDVHGYSTYALVWGNTIMGCGRL
jgi:hypothetical protein